MRRSTKSNKFRSPSSTSHYYFQKSSNIDLKPSPATKQLINVLREINFSPKNVLDLGCGNGRNSHFLAKKFGCETTLVDKQQEFLLQAEENLKKAGFHIKKVILSEIEALNQKSLETYDIVLCNYVLQNVHPKHYNKVISLLHSVTHGFLVIDIYQNPIVYELGKFTYRGPKGWYSFTKEEVLCLVNSNFDIVWQNGSVGWIGGPNTVNFIVSPRSKFNNSSLVIFEREIPSVYIIEPEKGHETKKMGKTTNKNTLKHEFQSLYPPCRECDKNTCEKFQCARLIHWKISIDNENGINDRNNQQLKQDYPICYVCKIPFCFGNNCHILSSWIKKVIND